MSAKMEQHDCKGGRWTKTSNLHGGMSNASRLLLSISLASGASDRVRDSVWGPPITDGGDYLTRVLGFSRNHAHSVHSDIDLCSFGRGFSGGYAGAVPLHSSYAGGRRSEAKALRMRCGSGGRHARSVFRAV